MDRFLSLSRFLFQQLFKIYYQIVAANLPVLGPGHIEHGVLLFCHLNDSQLVKDEPKGKECRVVTNESECHCNALE